MVASALTPELIKEGADLLRELDTAEAGVTGAFWFFFPDQSIWKLMLSLPNVQEGPRAAYEKVQKALSKLSSEQKLSLDDVVITKADGPILSLLRSAVRTGRGIAGIRFSNNVINGQLIPDAYIYRIS